MEQTALKTTQLGSTGLEITRVGFGAWAIGGSGWEFAWGARRWDARRPARAPLRGPRPGRRRAAWRRSVPLGAR
jgi:hypothetical protein